MYLQNVFEEKEGKSGIPDYKRIGEYLINARVKGLRVIE
jgi:hypothetical protein